MLGDDYDVIIRQQLMWNMRIMDGELGNPKVYEAHWQWRKAVKEDRWKDARKIYEDFLKSEKENG